MAVTLTLACYWFILPFYLAFYLLIKSKWRDVLVTKLCDSLLVTCGRSVVVSGYFGFIHMQNWPPRYNWILLKVALSNITLTLKLKLENVSSIITTLAICIYINKWTVNIKVSGHCYEVHFPYCLPLHNFNINPIRMKIIHG